MEEIRDYLRRPASMRLYSQGMVLFQKYALMRPQFAPHFATLSVGPMGNNIQTLEECLKACLQLAPPAPPKVVTVETKPKPASLAVKSRREVDLLVKIRKLRIDRAKTSQRFHSCESDLERAHICDIIEDIEAQIKETDTMIVYIQLHGAPPPEAAKTEDDPIPTDLPGLRKELNRVSNHILKIEKRIEHLETTPPSLKKVRLLTDRQEKLHYLISRRIVIKSKLDQFKKKAHEQNAG